MSEARRRSTGCQSPVPCLALTEAAAAPMSARYWAYSGTSWRLGEQQVVGREATHDVLARVGAVDAQHQLPAGEPLVEVGEVLVGGVGRGLLLERGDVDADRVGPNV